VILHKLKLHPFASFADKEISFASGLNVIYGANESGKSTLFKAIHSILFVNSKLTQSKFENLMLPFIPLGGDVSRVSISFSSDEKEYSIEKLWEDKNKEDVIFTQSDKSLVKDEKKINLLISNLLKIKENTFKSVLMTDVKNLENTIALLQENNNDTMGSLNHLLQKSVLNLDKISISKFQKLLSEKIKNYFNHWNIETWGPERNRGIKNPYKNDVGIVLQAYYNQENLELELERVRNIENELDRINLAYIKANGLFEETVLFIQQYKKLKKELSKYNEIQAIYDKLELELNELKKINEKWPVLENNLVRSENDIEVNQEKLKIIIEEEKKSIEIRLQEKSRKRFEKIEQLKNEFDIKNNELEKTIKIEKKDILYLQKINQKQNKIQTSLQAGKLSLQIKSKEDINFNYKKDIEDDKEKSLKKNKSLILEANARILLYLKELELSIGSGVENFEELERQSKQLKKEFLSILKKIKADTLEEAIRLNNIFEEKKNEFNFAQKIYLDELKNDDYEELKKDFQLLQNNSQSVRPIEIILKERMKIENDISNLVKEVNQTNQILSDYKANYTNTDKLLDSIIDKKEELNKAKKELKNISELPSEFQTIEQFLKTYEDSDALKDKLQIEKNDLLIEKNKVDKIDISVEELEKQFLDAQEKFNAVTKEAKSILKIQEISERLIHKSQSKNNIYNKLEKSFHKYSSEIFKTRYESIHLVDGLPDEFIRDNKTFSFQHLSKGTKDAFALVIRFVIAEFFLKHSKGFIILDDPLVNLDIKRFEKAAKVIQKFSQTNQVIYFTCHKNHADILGGNLIKLNK